MGTHKYNYNFDFFNTDSEELYYFWGFVSADGYLSNDSIEIALNQKDRSILDRFTELIVPDKPLSYKKKLNAYVFKIGVKKYINEFKKFLGMTTNNKHDELRFPNIPEQYIKDFIRGYVDGDGCIDTTKAYRGNTVYIGPRLRILGNKNFLESLNEMTKKFIKHNVNMIPKKGKENVYCVSYNFKTAREILKWLYENNNISLARKSKKANEVINTKIKI